MAWRGAAEQRKADAGKTAQNENMAVMFDGKKVGLLRRTSSRRAAVAANDYL